MSHDQQLADRYGRTTGPGARRKRNWIVASIASVIVISIVSWGIWTDAMGFGPTVSARDIGHSIIDEKNVSVDFELTATAGHEVACEIEAMNKSFTIVGWKVVVFPASTERVRVLREEIKTSEPAVTGLVGTCWLT